MILTCASNPYQKGKLLKTNNLIRNIKIFCKQYNKYDINMRKFTV